MLFSSHDQDWLVPFWQEHITPTLGPKAARQFVRATQSPSNWLADTIIKPRLFRPDWLGALYYPVDLDKFSVGRNHRLAELIASDPDPLATYGGDPWTGLTLFTNQLCLSRLLDQAEDDRAAQQPDPPKHRVVLGDHHIFTFECDVPDPEFLKLQLSWMRSSKNPLDCPLGALFRHCSGYADFAGVTVNYSGNKSLHFHLVFETGFARHRFKLEDVITSNIRRGLVGHWERLHEDVLRVLEVPDGIRADEHLRFPESFRRVPNGSRLIEAGHLLGFPPGTLIPQITFWEKARERAAGGELPLFFQPEPFHAEPTVLRQVRSYSPAKKLGHNLTEDEVRFCEERLRDIYPEWPRFDHLTFEGNRWVAKFRNSEADRNRSSIMREDFSTFHVVGRDAADLKPRALPYPLAIMRRYWRGQYQGKQGREDQALSIQEVLLAPPEEADADPLEERFRARVTDATSAQKEMQFLLRSTVAEHPLLLVVGPEGVGKTSTLMALHHEIIADLRRKGDSALAMYAFADYDAAVKKCAAFNAAQ